MLEANLVLLPLGELQSPLTWADCICARTWEGWMRGMEPRPCWRLTSSSCRQVSYQALWLGLMVLVLGLVKAGREIGTTRILEDNAFWLGSIVFALGLGRLGQGNGVWAGG